MDEEKFYEGITQQINETKDKLSALDKILKAFEKKEENEKLNNTLTNSNLKKTKNNENKTGKQFFDTFSILLIALLGVF